jgi:hypothetical protein
MACCAYHPTFNPCLVSINPSSVCVVNTAPVSCCCFCFLCLSMSLCSCTCAGTQSRVLKSVSVKPTSHHTPNHTTPHSSLRLLTGADGVAGADHVGSRPREPASAAPKFCAPVPAIHRDIQGLPLAKQLASAPGAASRKQSVIPSPQHNAWELRVTLKEPPNAEVPMMHLCFFQCTNASTLHTYACIMRSPGQDGAAPSAPGRAFPAPPTPALHLLLLYQNFSKVKKE